jgi:transcriptional regulator with AAA-type ATPase domain
MKILLSFTGFHDPYTKSLVGKEDQPGPVLSVMSALPFDRVVLLSTPRTVEITRATAGALEARQHGLSIEINDLPLNDPTDYHSILLALREQGAAIRERFPKAEISISTASGTPQMHACWLLLTASHELPAHLLHVRPPQFLVEGQPAVSVVDLTGSDFPIVRPRVPNLEHAPDSDGIPGPDLPSVLRELSIVAQHSSTQAAIQKAVAVAPYNIPTLILGETGTGKELIARLIHRISQRSISKFVPINCGAIPQELVESTLFGHKRGAFTGAITDLIGKFDLAHGGTLFLDEVGELPLPVQVKLLRVLEDSIIEPVGSNQRRQVDVRVVAATNRNLAEEIKAGRFREDLYYRLNTAIIRLPALKERRTEVPSLAVAILDSINQTLKKQRQISPEALIKLQAHDWPGNVRDLRNVLQRAVIYSGSRTTLQSADIVFDELVGRNGTGAGIPELAEGFQLENYLSDVRQKLMLRALEISAGNQSHAARLLGISAQAVSSFQKKRNEDRAST